MKKQKTVVLGVTSGIAAFKSLELIKLLRQEDVDVFVVMTKSATKMVDPSEFERISGNRALSELFEPGFDYKKILATRRVEHVDLADSADVFAIIPATANIIGKLANGIADDYLTTTALAMTVPVLIAPAMNVHMWNNPLTAENIAKLKKVGYQIIDPEKGMLACGYEGKGRLVDVRKIKDEIMLQLRRTESLKGKKIIVTAGGTTEKIDDVRYITNRSSGKMGVAIAEACFLRGADVLLLRAKNAVAPRYLMKEETFTTAKELFALIKKHIGTYDYIFHAAAVSDFSIAGEYKGKMSSTKSVQLNLQPNLKILDQIKNINPKIHLIAFKAEYGLNEKELISVSLQRLHESGADAIIANDISKKDRGFEADTNEVFIVFSDGSSQYIPLTLKREVAEEIVEKVLKNVK